MPKTPDNIIPITPDARSTAKEFARYGRQDPRIPIFMYRLGVVSKAAIQSAQERNESLHSSRFAPDPEPAIKTGVKTMTAAVLNLLSTR